MRGLLPAIGLLLAACAHHPAHGDDAPGPRLEDRKLSELSGLARSPGGGEWLWGHNDSGHDTTLFRIGLSGEALGRVVLKDAENVDWEDIADFQEDGQPFLLVGDIGDNRGVYPHYTLYALPEPAPDATEARTAWRIEFTYPRGPRDAEGMAVDPTDGEIYVLTKRDTPPGLYRVPRPDKPGEQVVAEHIVNLLTLPPPPLRYLFSNPVYGVLFNLPTALDIIAREDGGARMLVVTYGNAHIYDRDADETWADALSRAPLSVNAPRLPQIEAGAFTADGEAFHLGSEGRRTPLPLLEAPPPR